MPPLHYKKLTAPTAFAFALMSLFFKPHCPVDLLSWAILIRDNGPFAVVLWVILIQANRPFAVALWPILLGSNGPFVAVFLSGAMAENASS